MTQDNSSYDKYGKHGLLGEDSIAGGTEKVFVEPDSKSLRVNVWYWDVDTLSWVRGTQPGSGDSESQYNDSRVEYDSEGKAIYVGVNATYNAPTSAATWLVTTIEYTDGNITRASSRQTSWDNRAI